MDFFRKKKRDDGGDPFGSIFKQFFNEDFFEQIERMQRDMVENFGNMEIDEDEIKKMSEAARKTGGKPMVYGFSLKVGPDGKPVFQQFGNVEPEEKEVRSEREPLYDLINKEKEVTILVELPGVEKEEIKLNLGDARQHLIISAPGKFYKKVKLPAKVKSNLNKATYKNGILEINLEKEKAEKLKGTEIRVE